MEREGNSAMTTKTNKIMTHEEFLAREEFRARFDTEKTQVQRHYCTLFQFWRHCRFKPCRRARTCKGDQSACLRRSVVGVPRDRQFRARQDLLTATPLHIGAPERAAREFMPNEFWAYHTPSGKVVDVTEPAPRGWTRLSQRPPRSAKRKRCSRR
jgi:hypothetical protein